jgi:hypothetical protein
MDVICPGALERRVNSVGGDPHHSTPGVRSVQRMFSPQAKQEEFCGTARTSPVSTIAINEHAEGVRYTYNWCVCPSQNFKPAPPIPPGRPITFRYAHLRTCFASGDNGGTNAKP